MEYGESDAIKATHTYGNERISTGESYYLYDGRGSVANVATSSADILASYTYTPFGDISSGAPAEDLVFAFNGEEYNPLTGLQYLRARYYDTNTGRFGVPDTNQGERGDPLSHNKYTYTKNNPINYTDPSGHWALWDKIKSGAKKVVKAVGSGIKKAATAVYNNVLKPAATWVNKHIVQPVKAGAVKVYNTTKTAVEKTAKVVVSAAKATYNAAKQTVKAGVQYVQQKATEIKEKVNKFVCTVQKFVSDIDWGKVLKVALVVVACVAVVAITVATAGVGGALIGAAAGALGASAATAATVTTASTIGIAVIGSSFAVSDAQESLTGENTMKDVVFGGNSTAYNVAEGAFALFDVASGLATGTGKVAMKVAASSGDDVAKATGKVAGKTAVGSGDDVAEVAGKVAQKTGGKETAKKAYETSRPSYKKGQVEEVWETAKARSPDGKVYDSSGAEVTWDKTKPRNGQWDMGHIPGEKYSTVHKAYMDGKMSKEDFLKWYQDSANYRPELPSTNRSHLYE
jgi:RHS repeat-associated protein